MASHGDNDEQKVGYEGLSHSILFHVTLNSKLPPYELTVQRPEGEARTVVKRRIRDGCLDADSCCLPPPCQFSNSQASEDRVRRSYS